MITSSVSHQETSRLSQYRAWDLLSDQEALNIVGSCTDRSEAAENLVQSALQGAAKEAETTLVNMKGVFVARKQASRYYDCSFVFG